MFALFGLVFLIIKIGILSSVYSILTLLIFRIISKKYSKAWLNRLMNKKFLFWLGTGFVYSIALLMYAFSFWGNSGLGDYARIPVGNNFAIGSIDALDRSFFEPDKGQYSRQVFIINFAIRNKTICGEFIGYNTTDCKNCFIIFDTEAENIFEFNSAQEYTAFASKHDLPQTWEFKSFIENYREHWGGIRSIFLP